MARQKTTNSNGNSTATIGFEQKLWAAADALRNNMDATAAKRADLVAQQADGANQSGLRSRFLSLPA